MNAIENICSDEVEISSLSDQSLSSSSSSSSDTDPDSEGSWIVVDSEDEAAVDQFAEGRELTAVERR